MKIKKKIIFEIIILSILLTMASIIIINNILDVQKNFSALNNDLIPRFSLLKDMRLMASNVLVSTLEFTMFEEEFVTSNQEVSSIDIQSSEIISEIQRNKIQFNQLLELYKQHMLNTPINESTDVIEHQWKKFEILSDKFVDYRKRGISGTEFVKIKDEFKDSKDVLFNEIDSILLANEKNVEQKGQIVSELIRNTTIIVSLVVLIFVIVFIVLRYYLLRSILIPIFKIRNVTKKIAKDNLDIRIDDISKDEMGELSQDINQMACELSFAQEKLLKTEKLSVIGILAARLSHDMRNPLSIILVSLENIKMMYCKNETDMKHFDRIERAMDRITHQIDDVLGFIRKEPMKFEKTKISEIIADSLDSINLPNRIYFEISKNDFEFQCDKKRLSVAIANLLLNAIQGIDGKGTIKIDYTDTKEDIIIKIEDSGKGITSGILDNIFEPLFTTKQQGTGLGLASVKSIIEGHGGTISVKSPPTIFTITLPKMFK